MSQYPPPYPQYPMPNYPAPNYPAQWPTADPAAPAKRAGILMIIIGVIILLLGGCIGVTAAMIPQMGSNPEITKAVTQIETQLGVPATTLLFASAIVMSVIGLVELVLGVLARGGGLGVVITAIVFTAMILLYSVLNFVASLLMPGGIGGACFSVVMLAVFTLQLVWLIQAARNSGQVAAMKQLYSAGWMQPQMPMPPMMQNGYGQPPAGYGYGYGYGQVPPQAQQQQPPSAPFPPAENPPLPPGPNDTPRES